MEIQETLRKQELLNRCYVVWNRWNREKQTEETKVIIFAKPNMKKPFYKQIPLEILTKEQMKEKHRVEL